MPELRPRKKTPEKPPGTRQDSIPRSGRNGSNGSGDPDRGNSDNCQAQHDVKTSDGGGQCTSW